jgi:hypothetical protein
MKPQTQGERVFRPRMQAARWPQELSKKNAVRNLSLNFRPALLSTFCSERAPHKKTAAAKTGLVQPVPASTSGSIKSNQGKSR